MKNKKNKPADAESGRRAKNPPNFRRAIELLIAALISFFVYFGLIALSDAIGVYLPVMEVFTLLTAAAVCAIFIVNAGLGDTPPFRDELPAKWDDEKKQRFIDSFQKRKKAVKTLSFLLIAFVVPLLTDILSLAFDELVGSGG